MTTHARSLASRRASGRILVGSIAALLAVRAAQADNTNDAWLNTGATNANWSTADNWVGGVAPGSTAAITGTNADTSVATFNTAVGTYGTVGTPIVVDSASLNIAGITFATAAGNFTIGNPAGNPFYLSSGGAIQILATLSSTDAVETVNAPLVIQGNGGTYTFSNDSASGSGAGVGTLNIGGGITGGAAGATVLTLAGSNTNANTVSGVVADGSATSLAITKSGAGTWVLSGANTFTGATTINGGVLNIQNNTALGSTAAGTSVAGGAALQLQGGITVGAEALTLNGTGISADGALRNISGVNTYGGLVTLGSATRIQSDAGTLLLTSTGTITGGTFGLTVGGAGNSVINGIIGTTSGTLTKEGAGTLSLTAANTFTGNTTISNGVVNIQNATGLGTVAGTASVTAGAALQLQGGITVGAKPLTLNGTGVSTDGALRNIIGANVWQGPVTLGSSGVRINSDAGATIWSTYAGSLTLNTAAPSITGTNTDLTLGGSGDGTVSGVISTGSGALTKDGNGVWVLGGLNTYTGLTTVSAGVLRVNNALALGTAAAGTSVTAGAALQLGTFTVTAEALTLNGTGQVNDGALRAVGNGLWQSTVTLGASGVRINSDSGSTLTFNTAANSITGTNTDLLLGGAGNITVGGTITIGSGRLIKDGTGTVALTGASTYTGNTVVGQGTLNLGNSTATGSLDPTGALVLSGGTFTYSRTGTNVQAVGGVTVNAGASAINDTVATDTLSLGAINRSSTAGTVTFATATGPIQTTTVNSNGMLGPWALFGSGTGLRYAVGSAAGAATTITGLTGTTATAADLGNVTSATTNYELTGGGAPVTSINLTANTLRNTVLTTYLNIGTGKTLTVNGLMQAGGTSSNATSLFNIAGGNVVIGSGNELVVAGNGQQTAIFSAITDGGASGGVSYSGSGSLNLLGANTYTGATNVATGTLVINSIQNAGSSTANSLGRPAVGAASVINLGTGSNLQYVSATAGSSDRVINMASPTGGTFTLSVGNGMNGGGSTPAGVLPFAGGALTLSGGIATAGTSGISTLALASAPASLGVTHGTLSGTVVDGTGTNLTALSLNSGGWALTGANTYSGNTTIAGGSVLNIRHATALGNTTSGTAVASGGSLQLQGGISVGAEALSLNGTGGSSSTYGWTGNYDGALRSISGTNTYGGTITLAGAARIAADAGTLTLSNASSVIALNQNLSVGGAGNITISGAVALGTGTLTKELSGTATLNGANILSGTVTVNGGTLQVGGTLNTTGAAVAGPALTFGGTGTFVVSEASGLNQNMGTLTFSAGEGTVQSTNNGGNSFLTFAAAAARTGGATRNFVTTNGTNGTTNSILLTGQGAGFLDQGSFFGGSSYAWMNATGTYVRALDYATDAGAATTGLSGSGLPVTTHAQMTGAVTGQGTQTLTTLNISGDHALTINGGAVLTVNGILKTGNNGSPTVISGGTLQPAASTELVVRTNQASDALTISSVLVSNGGSFTKSGAGTLNIATTGATGAFTMLGGALNITNGNILTSSSVTTGGGSNAAITISGTGSTWTSSNAFTLGNAGYGNTLSISSAGTLNTAAGTIGNSGQASNNAVTIDGTGSKWAATGAIILGNAANSNQNSITLSNGALLTTNNNGITIGGSGSYNSMSILSGSTVGVSGNNYAVTVGNAAGAIGNSLTIDGTNSKLLSGGITVGNSSNYNTLTVSNGGSITSTGGLTIGNNTNGQYNTVTFNSGVASTFAGGLNMGFQGGRNTLILDGTGTNISFGTLQMGFANGADYNTLKVLNGARLTTIATGSSFIGGRGGGSSNTSYNQVIVDGAGSQWIHSASGDTNIGNNGSYLGLTISNGGFVNVQNSLTFYMNFRTGTQDYITITGANSSMNLANSTLDMQNGGTGKLLNIYNGGALTSVGTIMMANQTSTLINLGDGNAIASMTLNNISNNGGIYINNGRMIARQTNTGFINVNALVNLVGAGYFSIGSTFAATIAAPLIGPGSLAKEDTGTLILSNAGNTYSGGSTVSGGILQASGSGIFGSTSGSMTVNSGGTLDLNNTNQTVGNLTGTGGTIVNNGSAALRTLTIGNGNGGGGNYQGVIADRTTGTGTLALTKTGNGTITLSGLNTYTGTTTLNGGILNVASADTAGVSGPLGASVAVGSIVFGGGTLQYSASNSYDYSARFSTAASQPISIDTNSQTVTFATALTSAGGTLSKTGLGTLALSSAGNTYSGGTTVTGGTLQASGAGVFGSTSGTMTVNTGGALDLNGTNQSVGNFTGTGGTVVNNASATASILTIGTGNTGGGNYAGVIADHTTGTGTLGLTKTGNALITVSGANTYTGGTIVDGGTLQASGSGTFGAASNSMTVNAGGILDLNTTTQTVGNLTGTGGSILNNGSTASTLTIGSGNGTGGSYQGVIADNNNAGSGTVALTKTGSGTIGLAGTNTYTGATAVNAGTLVLTGNLGNTAIAASTGGTFSARPGSGTGYAGTTVSVGTSSLTLNGGASSAGSFDMIDNAIGTFRVGSGGLVTTSGATMPLLTFEIGNSAGSIDLLDFGTMGGSVNAAAGTLLSFASLTGATSLANGNYTFLTAANGLGPSAFTLSSPTVSVGGNTYTLSLASSTSTAQILTVTYTPVASYTLVASAGSTKIRAGSGTSTITATITNTGTGAADNLNFSGFDVSSSGGTLGSRVGLPASNPSLPNATAGGNTAAGTAVFSAATGGSYTVTPAVSSALNATIGGAAANAGVTPATVEVYNLAAPTTVSGSLGNYHVGVAKALSLTNGSAGAYNEDVNATIAVVSNTSVSGSVTQLLAGSTDNTSLLVTLGGGSGAQTGQVSVGLTSAGTVNGVSNTLGTTALTSQTVNVSGTGYNLAAAASTQTVNVPVAHVGGTSNVAVTLTNTAPVDATYTETLSSAGFSGTTANFTAAGSVAGIAGGGSGSGTLLVGLGSNLPAGAAQTGTTTLALSSTEVNASGLGTTTVSSQTITIVGDVFDGTGIWNLATGVSGSWGDNANWLDANGAQGAPGTFGGFDNTDIATFDGTGTVAAIALDGASPSLKALNFNSSLTSYEIDQGAGSTGLTLKSSSGATVTVTSGTHVITAPVTLASNTTVNVVPSTEALAITGNIDGASGLTKTGSGELLLTGSNTFGGSTTVTGGILTINALDDAGTSALGNTGSISVGNATLRYTGVGATSTARWSPLGTFVTTTVDITQATGGLTINSYRSDGNAYQSITKVGDGTFTLTGNISFFNAGVGSVSVSGGTLVLGATGFSDARFWRLVNGSVLDVMSGATLQFSGNNVANQMFVNAFHMSGGTFDLNGDTANTVAAINASSGTSVITNNSATTNATLTVNLNSSVSFNGNIVDGSRKVAVNLAAGANTWTLSGNNTYSGATTVGAGTLKAGSTTALSSNSVYTVGATLDLANNDNQIAGLTGAGTVQNSVTGTAILTVNNDTATSNASYTFSGVLQNGGVGQLLGLKKIGDKTLTLSGANTYGGGTQIDAGTLTGTGASPFGATTGSLAVNNPNTGAGTAVVLNLTTDAPTTTGTLSGAIAAPSGGTNTATINNGGQLFTVNQMANATFAGQIAGIGGFTLGALSTNALTFTGANLYTGLTTVSAGTLNLNTTGGDSISGHLTVSGGSAVLLQSDQINDTKNVVVSGGTLDIAGNSDTVNGVQLASGSITGSGGTLTSGTAFDLQAGSASAILAGASGALKTTAGTVTLTGANTYTGGTTISGGILNVNADAALGDSTGAVDMSNGATLQAAGTVTTAARTLTLSTVAGGVIDTNGNTVNFNSGSTVTGTKLTKTGAGTLNVGAGAGLLTGLAALEANNGTTNVNSILGTGTSTVDVTGTTTLKFGSVSQTLGSLSIGAGSTVTFTSGLASFSGGSSGGKAPSFGGSAVVPEPGTLGLLLVGALGMLNRRRRA